MTSRSFEDLVDLRDGSGGFSRVLARPVPDILYHYTTQAGLIGILEHGKLWATHIRYLNDAREYVLAHHLVVRELRRRAAETSSPELREFLVLCEESVSRSSFRQGGWVFSMSRRKDDLSQWRAYSGAQPGFALAFRTEALISLLHRSPQPGFDDYLAPVAYRRSLHRALAAEIVDDAVRRFDSNPEARKFISFELLLRFQRRAPVIKDSSFAAEQEWRLVTGRPVLRVRHRPGRSSPVPFIEFSLGSQPNWRALLDHVVVGPGPSKRLAAVAVESLLISAGGVIPTGIAVQMSKTPFRNW
jgi:hypothetical protein